MNINSNINHGDNLISTSLLLAAGTCSRLYPLTRSFLKCPTLADKLSPVELKAHPKFEEIYA